MNQPEYILVDEIETLVANASTQLISDGVLTTAINYQYGYLEELKTKLQQASVVQSYARLKYPLIWIVQPFQVRRVNGEYYGDTSLRLFIIQQSEAGLFAEQRMANTFKPILYPIYRKVMGELENNRVFDRPIDGSFVHTVTDRYYWGEEQQEKIDDIFDCMEISGLQLKIKNNPNCEPVGF